MLNCVVVFALLVTLTISLPSGVTTYSIWNCKGWQKWKTISENVESSRLFQRWIHAWQNNCHGRYPVVSHPILHGAGGYGHSFQKVAEEVIKQIELGRIYVSTEDFAWADKNHSACTHGVKSISCYFKPLSSCAQAAKDSTETMSDIENDLKIISFKNVSSPLDTCSMGEISRKSLIWVYGQFLLYLLRPRVDILTNVRSITDPILNSIDSKTESLVAVHIRGGAPDGDRIPLNVSFYVEKVDILAKELAALGKPVKAVFLCSDSPNENIKSSESMSSTFPRSWKYFVIPHTSLGPGESEYNLRNPTILNKPSNRILMTEFLADLELLTSADAFIGSASNIYFMVSALRAAKQIGLRNHTCQLLGLLAGKAECLKIAATKAGYNNVISYHEYLNSKQNLASMNMPCDNLPLSTTFQCENSPETKKMWAAVSGGYDADSGSSFAQY